MEDNGIKFCFTTFEIGLNQLKTYNRLMCGILFSLDQRIKRCMVFLYFFDESQTRLADSGNIPQCKSKNARGLNEVSLPLARMHLPVGKTARFLPYLSTPMGVDYVVIGFDMEVQP